MSWQLWAVLIFMAGDVALVAGVYWSWRRQQIALDQKRHEQAKLRLIVAEQYRRKPSGDAA